MATPCLLAEHRRSRVEQFPAASAEREYYFADWRDCIIQSFLPVCSDTANTNHAVDRIAAVASGYCSRTRSQDLQSRTCHRSNRPEAASEEDYSGYVAGRRVSLTGHTSGALTSFALNISVFFLYFLTSHIVAKRPRLGKHSMLPLPAAACEFTCVFGFFSVKI